MAILDLFNLPETLELIEEYLLIEYVIKSMFIIMVTKLTIEAIFDLSKSVLKLR